MDLTSLGITFGYGIEITPGTKPNTFTQLKRCNSIPEINLESEQIDVSALEDKITQYAEGRQDTGGTWSPVFNFSEERATELMKMIDDSKTAKNSGKRTWYEVLIPGVSKGFFVVATPGEKIPLPSIEQNGALTVPISLTINEYVGLDDKVDFGDSGE